MISSFSFPTKIVFGPRAIEQVGDAARSFSMKHPLLVTDPGIVRSGLLERLTAPLSQRVLPGLSSKGGRQSDRASVFPGVNIFHAEHCDGVIAMGGGSSLDAGKAIRLKATHPLPLGEYDDLKNGASLISADLPPMVAIPPTSGTGSEVGRDP